MLVLGDFYSNNNHYYGLKKLRKLLNFAQRNELGVSEEVIGEIGLELTKSISAQFDEATYFFIIEFFNEWDYSGVASQIVHEQLVMGNDINPLFANEFFKVEPKKRNFNGWSESKVMKLW